MALRKKEIFLYRYWPAYNKYVTEEKSERENI